MSKIMLNPFQDRIIRILARGRRALTTSQVANFSGISYNTTKKHLLRLNNRGLVSRKKKSNRIFWWV